jgi:site-specific DNA-cytosine methylase
MRILRDIQEYNPDIQFLLENVKMSKKWKDVLSAAIGVEPILINSSLVTAQNRERYYWTSWQNTQPADKGLVIADILEDLEPTALMEVLRPCEPRDLQGSRGTALCHHVANASDINGNESIKRVYADSGKAPTLTTMQGGHRQPKVFIDLKESVAKNVREQHEDIIASDNDRYLMKCTSGWQDNMIALKKSPTLRAQNSFCAVLDSRGEGYYYRKLTPLECERLQTLPDHYSLIVDADGKQLVSNSQRYKAIGNGWSIDVIVHLLKALRASSQPKTL